MFSASASAISALAIHILTPIVAHGVLGQYDEVIIPVVGGAFIGVLVITWLSSRGAEVPPNDVPPINPDDPTPPSADSTDHYRLD